MQWFQQILSQQPDWFISLKYGLFVLGFCLLGLAGREILFWFLKLNRLRDKLESIEKQNKEILKLLEKTETQARPAELPNNEEPKKDRFSLGENLSFDPENNGLNL